MKIKNTDVHLDRCSSVRFFWGDKSRGLMGLSVTPSCRFLIPSLKTHIHSEDFGDIVVPKFNCIIYIDD